MLKVGIISLFDLVNLNYGNRLQAYALNRYINEYVNGVSAKTLYFNGFKDFKRTKTEPITSRIKRKVLRDIIHKKDKILPDCLKCRLKSFNEFCVSNIDLIDDALSMEELRQQEFDAMIVGSDVVWYQWQYGIRPVKLLDFEMVKPYKKISYAASFGNDIIPLENVEELKRCLSSFSYISVREKSSIDLLKQIGVEKAEHVLDPTLLLDRNDWYSIESSVNELKGKKYIFAYILNRNEDDRKSIIKLGKQLELPIVTVPYAAGIINKADDSFGDHRLMNCTLQEWVWLIHNAELVITDSFHGAAFSANLKKKFLVTKRKESFDMNNRMVDFLQLINQKDKYISIENVTGPNDLVWDYDMISSIISDNREKSVCFLHRALSSNDL